MTVQGWTHSDDWTVVLVTPRVLRRVIKTHRSVPGIGFDVPHGFSYVLPKTELIELSQEEELGVPADSLADSVILLERPDGTREAWENEARLWRQTFHASIHHEIEQRKLTLPDVRARINAIGQTEFDEIRFVLRQDDLLLPPDDDLGAYIEFAATYLELRSFAPAAVARTFPALERLDRVDATLGQDVDAKALLDRTRPPTSPEIAEVVRRMAPQEEEIVVATRRSEAHTVAGKVSPAAAKARSRGNLIRSILLRVRVKGTEADVETEVTHLVSRIATALRYDFAPPVNGPEIIAEWVRTLMPIVKLAPAAHRLPWNPEARLLYDLQMVAIDHERELFALDVVEWCLSLGKRPVKRPLPAQREVRIVKHLERAIEKLARTGLLEVSRAAVARLLRQWRKRADVNLRTSLGPRIDDALRDVGLAANNLPERVSKQKLVDELLDQIEKHGYVSLGHLRDSLSRSNVKMANLRLSELYHGDALLQADKILSYSLDGVYRRGEIYLRILQKFSSITFGTPVGRFLTLYAFLPLVGAFVLLEGLQHTAGLLWHKITGSEPHLLTTLSFAVTTAVLFTLIHSARARAASMFALKKLGTALKWLFWTFPIWLWHRHTVQAFVKSEPVKITVKYLLKPALFASVLTTPARLFTASPWILLAIVGVLLVAWNILLNSAWGERIEEAATDWLVRRWRQLSRRVLPGLLGLITDVFRRLLEAVDRAIYTVDELLRFREGEGQFSMGFKAALGVAWFFITYVIRVYVTLLLEPEVNPIKHFPVVTVAAKIMIPVTKQLHDLMADPLTKVAGPVIAESFAGPTVVLLPGFFGFLTWELKENWRLYRLNRPPTLAPVMIGHHGETMVAFMKPGFHSGTIPKVYAKLRRATWKRHRSALRHREALHHIEESIRSFAERELARLLNESTSWRSGLLEVGHIDVASNRVRVEIICAGAGEVPVQISFEEQSGWLLGSIPRRGFLERIPQDQLIVFENALAGFYKIAGVELVREQIIAGIGDQPYDIAGDGLIVWPSRDYRTEVVYDLHSNAPLLRGRVRDTEGKPASLPDGALPITLASNDLFFSKQIIRWAQWVEAWSDAAAASPPRLIHAASLIKPPGQPDQTIKLDPHRFR